MRPPTLPILLSFLSLAALAHAQTILNPYYSETSWKIWLDDPAPVVIPTDQSLVAMPAPSLRLYPTDVSRAEAETGVFMKFLPEDYPGRKYAGFHHDLYQSFDDYHTVVDRNVVGDNGNEVSLKDEGSGKFGGYRLIHFRDKNVSTATLGTLYTNQSTTLMGDYISNNGSRALAVERDFYFRNILRMGPSFTSTPNGTSDEYAALLPSLLNGYGASFGQPPIYSRMIVAGAYLPIETKRKLLRNGLYMNAMLYAWKAGLPFHAPYDSPRRHTIAYLGGGVPGEEGTGAPGNSSYHANAAFDRIHQFDRFPYNPSEHLHGMIEILREMDTMPPVSILKSVEVLSGTPSAPNQNYVLHTAARIDQAHGETVQLRVVDGSYDLQSFPLQTEFRVLYGNKQTRIEHDPGDPTGRTYLITVPWDEKLPVGRTTILMTAHNGLHAGNPAAINVYRPTATGQFPSSLFVEPLPLKMAKRLPGESLLLDLFAIGSGSPTIEFDLWNSTNGHLDGNRFELHLPVEAEESREEIVVFADDGSTGNATGGTKTAVEILHTIAEIDADKIHGFPNLSVQFDGTGSRDKDGNPLTYHWDFGNGQTSNLPAPSHTYTEPGIYLVSLTVTGPLGTDTDHLALQVIPDHTLPLVLSNGWNSNGLDPDNWTGSSVSIKNGTLELDAAGGTAVIESVANFPGALWLEADFHYTPGFTRDFQHWFEILGHRFGNVPADPGNDTVRFHPFGIWTNPDTPGETTELIGPVTGELCQLKLFADDDPAHPGRIRLTGLFSTELGVVHFQYDDLPKLDDQISIHASSNRGRITVQRLAVWSHSGSPVQSPALEIVDHTGRDVLLDSDSAGIGARISNDRFFGTVSTAGGTLARTFTIRNRGTTDLTFTNDPPLADRGAFKVTRQPDPTLPPGTSSTFTYTFTPPGPGPHNSNFHKIETNDPSRGSAGFAMLGFGFQARELSVRGRGLDIANGETLPSIGDGTLFPSTTINQSSKREFLLYNLGTETLSGLVVQLTDSQDFQITHLPRSSLSSNGSTRLGITFAPSTTGRQSADVAITSDDPDTPVYTFTIEGTAEAPLPDPVMEILGNGLIISRNDFTSSTIDGTDAGEVAAGASQAMVFTIRNTQGKLQLGETSVTGPDASHFSVVEDPWPQLFGGQECQLQVLYHPTAPGVHDAMITIPSNDPNADYSFSIRGEGVPAPILLVTGNDAPISREDDSPSPGDGTRIGPVLPGENETITFHLDNPSASESLTITSVDFSGVGADAFEALTALPLVLPPGGTASLEVMFSPTTSGVLNAVVTILSDAHGGDYRFHLQGIGPLWSSSQPMLYGLYSSTMEWGDFDGDGDFDLAASGFVGTPTQFLNTIGTAVFRNDDGQLVNGGIGTLTQYGAVQWADADADGDLDLYVSGANPEAGAPFGHLVEIENGQQIGEESITEGLIDSAAAWGDFDRDGDLDLVVNGQSASDFASVYLNQPAGFIDSGIGPQPYYDPTRQAPVWADFDEDGDLDLVINERLGALRVYKNTGDELLLHYSHTIDPIHSSEVELFAAGDLDQDGDLDILAYGSDRWQVFRNDGHAGFSLEVSEPLGFRANALRLGDFDNDGDLDVVLSGRDTATTVDAARIWFNDGNGQFTLRTGASELTGINYGALAVVDFDGDGDLDVSVTGRDYRQNTGIAFYMNENLSPVPNTQPQAPRNLLASLSGRVVTFEWEAAVDAETPSPALSYNIRIGTSPGRDNIAPAEADLLTGQRRVVRRGSIQGTKLTMILEPGLHYVAVQAIDAGFAGGAWSQEIAIVVDGSEIAPLANDDQYRVEINTTSTLDLLDNDFDPGDQFAITSLSGGVGTIVNEGSHVIYTPPANFLGQDSFAYTITDSTGHSATADVQIEVYALPSARSDQFSLHPDRAHTVAAPGILANDHQIDGAELTAMLSESPEFGALELRADGSFDYHPAAGFQGVDTFRYRVLSSAGDLSNEATVVLAVVASQSYEQWHSQYDWPIEATDGFHQPAPGLSLANGFLYHQNFDPTGLLPVDLVDGSADGGYLLNGSFESGGGGNPAPLWSPIAEDALTLDPGESIIQADVQSGGPGASDGTLSQVIGYGSNPTGYRTVAIDLHQSGFHSLRPGDVYKLRFDHRGALNWVNGQHRLKYLFFTTSNNRLTGQATILGEGSVAPTGGQWNSSGEIVLGPIGELSSEGHHLWLGFHLDKATITPGSSVWSRIDRVHVTVTREAIPPGKDWSEFTVWDEEGERYIGLTYRRNAAAHPETRFWLEHSYDLQEWKPITIDGFDVRETVLNADVANGRVTSTIRTSVRASTASTGFFRQSIARSTLVHGGFEQPPLSTASHVTQSGAGEGWYITASGSSWSRPLGGSELRVVDGAQGACIQVVEDGYATRGTGQLSFDVRNIEGAGSANKLTVALWGVDDAFQVSLDGHATPSVSNDGSATLLKEWSMEGESFDWRRFELPINFGHNGYRYWILSVTTEGVAISNDDEQEIDSFYLGR